MNARTVAYWTTTSFVALGFFSAGVGYLAGAEVPAKALAELGYPSYFLPFLGLCKVLGAVALVAPRLPRVKEWTYAGMTFNLLAAAFSHAASGHPAGKVALPLVLLAMTLVSWALRPASRAFGTALASNAGPGAAPALAKTAA